MGRRGDQPGSRGDLRGQAAAGSSRIALRERPALWLRMRFGVEPRTVLALTVVLILAVGFAVQHFWSGRPRSVAAPAGVQSAAGRPGPDRPGGSTVAVPGGRGGPGGPAGKRVVVDVTGKVDDPGVHRLPSGSRVEDALDAAGGTRRGAKLGNLNRARLLVDGEQIVVGAAGAPAPGPAPPGGDGASPGSGGSSGGAAASAGAAGPGGAAGTVSLSSATAEQLDSLPGVGPVLARHILDYRTQHGGFTSIDQLRDVDGIGDRRFADIKPQVTP